MSLVEILAKALVNAMLTDTWDRVLLRFAEVVRPVDVSVADVLEYDLQKMRARLMEAKDDQALDGYTARRVQGHLSVLLELLPDLTPAVEEFLRDELAEFSPPAERPGEPDGVAIQAGAISGQIMIGGMVQPIGRDQVRDA